MKQIASIGELSPSSGPAKRRCQRDALVAAIAIFLFAATANTVLYRNARASRLQSLEDNLRAHASHAALAIDPSIHARLASPATGSPDHLAELAKLYLIRRSYPILRNLYSVRADTHGNLQVILDTPPPSASPAAPREIGRPINAPKEEIEKILTFLKRGESHFTGAAYFGTDNEGVMIPLPRLSPDFLDFVVADLNIHDADATLGSLFSAYCVALLVSAALAVLGGFAVFGLRLRETVARQMRPGDSKFFRKMTMALPGLLYHARVSRFGLIKLTYASDASRWVYEMEPEALRKDPGAIYRLIHPDDRAYLKEKMVKAIKESDVWQEEFRVILPKAGLRWRLGVAHVERLADGSSLWYGFVTDTTWRKTAEDALRKRDASLKAAQQVAGMGNWDLDLSSPAKLSEKPLRWSDETFRIFGLQPHAVPVSNDLFFRMVHPDDRDAIANAFHEALRTNGRYSIDHRIIRPDGEIRHVHEDAVILLDDKSGEPLAMMGIVHDITDRVLKEEAVRLNEQRLKLATQAGRVGTWDYDVISKKILWNDVMYTMKKLDPATFDPNLNTSESLLHPDDHDRVMTEFNRCLNSFETRYEVECRVILKDGEILHTRSTAEILRDADGKALRCVGIEVDITAQKIAIEAALAADRAKSEFLAMMSHEIRTPMNGVLGFTSLLKETSLASDQREYVATIESSGQHLLLLINDILDLSKIESGRIRIQCTSFTIRPFVQELFTLLRPRAEEKKLGYQLDFDPSVPEAIHTDRTRLGQILTNLLGNAVKFTDYGSVHVRVSARRMASCADKWEWTFSVRDTGCGIAPDMLRKIFEPFYQADLSATRRHGGTGLGLAISQRLAHLLDGDIGVTSDPREKGSVFVATIRAADGVATPIHELIAPLDAGRFAGKKILIVDDDPIGRKLCSLQLGKLGFETSTARNGLDAVSQCGRQNFDAILMDVQMPEMDGFTATRAIRKNEKKRTPIIALTANAMPEDRERSLEAGMDDYVSKPMRIDVLLQALSRWI